jgi:hypothetical protein
VYWKDVSGVEQLRDRLGLVDLAGRKVFQAARYSVAGFVCWMLANRPSAFDQGFDFGFRCSRQRSRSATAFWISVSFWMVLSVVRRTAAYCWHRPALGALRREILCIEFSKAALIVRSAILV